MAAKDFRAYVNAMNQASLLAQRDLAALWEKVKGVPPAAARDALIALLPGIIYRYGGMAALAAAEYYEAERPQAGGGDFTAELSDGVPLEQIEASVRYAVGHMFAEDGTYGAQPEPDAELFGGQGR